MSSATDTTASPPVTGGFERSRSGEWLLLGGLLFAGFLIRLLFIGADGYKNDIASFESWALQLVQNPLWTFYDRASFLDYPPGYLYVLWIVGWVHQHFALPDPSFTHLKYLVKLPGIIMDLVDAALLFAIVRRFAPPPMAFASAAFFVFNPSAIMISSYWGQVDSVPAGLALAAVLLLIMSSRSGDRGVELAGAWLALAFSVLMKPAAVAIVPIFLAYPFLTRDTRAIRKRLEGTAIGILAAFVFADLATIPFHPGGNPIGTLTWLYERYAHGKDVYPFNSINAFNLYAVFKPFWQPDNQVLLFMPQWAWGLLLFLSACVLITWRLLQRREEHAILEAAFLLSFAYFLFPTRIHERYVFDAFAFAPALFFIGRRYVWGASAITLTLFANLLYSLYYMRVFDEKIAVADATRLMPWLSAPASALNVIVFFYLGYVFLGAAVEGFDLPWRVRLPPARTWFNPLEGVRAMTRMDYGLGWGLALLFFVVAIVNLAWPNEKIFDEIYYARAAEEYLKHMDLFEWTHPPLTKLVITLSTWMIGDTTFGWRFMNLVVGSISVALMYAFAKRLLGSTLFAAIAAGMLAFDGFHFVQSRIATPEITVAFFSLLTLYAFYRYWIATSVRVVPEATPRTPLVVAIAAAAGITVAIGVSLLAPWDTDRATHIVTFLYVGLGTYLLARLLVPYLRRTAAAIASYAEGTRVRTGEETVVHTFDGGSIRRGTPLPGDASAAEAKALLVRDDQLTVEYDGAGTARYRTPIAAATFAPVGVMDVGESVIAARDAKLWIWILAISSGALAASKWNGLFDFFVVWFLAALVFSQRWWARIAQTAGLRVRRWPAYWGNPFGFPIDVMVGLILFVSATIYGLAYIPYFDPHLVDQSKNPIHHAFADLLVLQRSMYAYHHDLRATHPYGSQWWQWPLLLRPISYYYHDFREAGSKAACCVAEILALPNPLVWWLGLVSVPLVALRAWIERNKGFALLAVAYLFQWVPWIGSPRVAFEYHFYPNLAVIVLANAALLQWLWNSNWSGLGGVRGKHLVMVYCAAVVLAFIFWYPILSGVKMNWSDWDMRLLHPLMGNDWI